MDGLTVLERHGGREAVEWAKRGTGGEDIQVAIFK